MGKTLWLGNTHFPCGWTSDMSPEDAKALAAKAAKRRKALKLALKKAGKGKGKTEKQKAYVGSTLVRLDALVQAAKRHDYSERKELPEYQEMAGQLKLHQPIADPVRVYLKEKSVGGYRYFCNFGVRHRAAQAIVADMVGAQFKPKPFQYNAAGRGVRDAVKKVRKLHADGYVHAVRLDIHRFFDSFDHDAILAALPIANDVVEHVVIGKHMDVLPGKMKGGAHLQTIIDEFLSLIGQRGLPQGSACSPAIANFFISKIKPTLPKGTRFLNYVDDFLVLAQSPERAQKAKNALTSSVEEMPVGKFKLLEKSSSFLASGVEFLGHHFSENEDGKVRVLVSDANVLKIRFHAQGEYDRIKSQYASMKGKPWGPLSTTEANVRYALHILSWLKTFSEADDISEYGQELFGMIGELAIATGQDPHKILNLANMQKLKDVDFYGA